MWFITTLHCETEWNMSGLLQGHIDTDLHEVGIAHARLKARALQEQHTSRNKNSWRIKRIVSSDLKRAIKTAEIINERLNVPHEIDARLRECCYGSLQGLHTSDLIARYPEWCDSFVSYDYRDFGGECREDVIKRQLEALIGLKRTHHSEDILIVGHGTSINSLFSSLGEKNLPVTRDEIRVLIY